VDGTRVTVEELNRRRRHAVTLRLAGEKLAAVCLAAGLSAPTVIAAVKAYRAGGWPAVDVHPRRGRPAQDHADPSHERERALLEAMLDDEHQERLWSRQRIARWLSARGWDRSAGAIARFLRDAAIESATAAPLLPSRHAGVLHLHATQRYLDPRPGLHPAMGLLATRTPRGQWLWLAFRPPLQGRHCVGFLSGLQAAHPGELEVRWPGAAALLRVPEVRDWLAANTRLKLADPEIGAPAPPNAARPAPAPSMTRTPMTTTLTHLQRLEAESIHILREVVAEAEKPVMLYSIGKDSAVMLHLAMKAFYPAKPPFPLLHVDTRWKFRDMYAFRDRMVSQLGLELIVHVNPEGVARGINPFTHGSAIHTDVMKTEGLKQALGRYGFDSAFGGARRDEEKSRAKERVFSFRSAQHRWDPKNQRPELWRLYNARKHKGESFRVFPLSNWTELDVWQYIHLNDIPVVPLYFAAERPVVERGGTLIMVDDDRMPLQPGEVPMRRKVRFRTLGCYPLTGAVESDADTLPAIIREMLLARTSERQGRVIDHDGAASMEKKKQEGYF
jgi:sulfate adenylyltransferase subunit 2